MPPRASLDRLLGDVETNTDAEGDRDICDQDPDSYKRKEVEERLLRKLDLRLLFLILIIIMNQVDRSNIAAARLKGLEEDLHLTGQQFNTLISIMYVGYTLTQIPSNIFLDRLRRPSIYLSYCVLLWGIISISIGFAQSYRAVLVSRFFLGFTEATYYPGVVFLLSRWYKRDELGLRMAYFGFGVYLSAVLGPIIASGILATMDGILGYAAWRWLFFIEGGLTCLIAAAGVYIIPDFPSTPVSWLTPDEQILAQRRMAEDLCGIKQEGTQKSGLVEAFTDWTVWWLAIARSMATVGESFGNFLPTLAATIGYNASISLLLSAGPWVLSMAMSYYVSQHSDATRDRFWHITAVLCGGIMGFFLGILTMNPVFRYLSLLLMAQSDVSYIIFFAWVSNSIPEPSKRAVAIAFINACSMGIANVGASYLWPASWGPSYSKSYVSCILAYTTCILMLWVYRSHLIRLNKKAEMDERALGLSKGFRHIEVTYHTVYITTVHDVYIIRE